MTAVWTLYTRLPPTRIAIDPRSYEVRPYAYQPPTWDDRTWTTIFHMEEDPELARDPMAGSVWAAEMAWKTRCRGSAPAREACIQIAREAQGGLYDHEDDVLTWYGWDGPGFLARTHALIESNQLGELLSWFAELTTIHAPPPGPLTPLAEHAIAYLDDIPDSTAKNQLLVALARCEQISMDHRRLLEDAVLAAPPKGKGGNPLRELQSELRRTAETRWASLQPLPATADELAALWARADEDPRATHLLARAMTSGLHTDLVIATILGQARGGAPVPRWTGWASLAGSLSFAHTHEYDLDHREFFALCGPLAAWLVDTWRRCEDAHD